MGNCNSFRSYTKLELEGTALALHGLLRNPEAFAQSATEFLDSHPWIAPVMGYLHNGKLRTLADYLALKHDAANAFLHPITQKDRAYCGEETSTNRILTLWVVLPFPGEEGVPNRFHFKEVEDDTFICTVSNSIFN